MNRPRNPRPVAPRPKKTTIDFDVDYWGKLDKESKEWLRKFERESVYHRGLTKKHKPLHKTDKQKRELYNSRNAKAREVQIVLKGANAHQDSTPSPEDAIIEAIDAQKNNS